MCLTRKNLEGIRDSVYLCVRSQKTATDTRIKLPGDALSIIEKYKRLKTLLPVLSDSRLNLNLKDLCAQAGWTHEMDKVRTLIGIEQKLKNGEKPYRFCDLVTTHTMRRTAITTLLCLGVPEIMVQKNLRDTANSTSFHRYVEYAQRFIDEETDKAFEKLSALPINI